MSIERLKYGFKATKFHYSQKKSRECTLKLSDDGRIIYWIYNGSTLSSEFMKRYVVIENIKGIIYGPQS
jgi:hypothetical protein